MMSEVHLTTASSDGTELGYFRIGRGPALVISHGSVSAARQWSAAARHLAENFTCFVYDRRGRGKSGDSAHYDISVEVADIDAMMDVAGPGAHLLGHSYGALCTLAYAERRAVTGTLLPFEPPLAIDGEVAGRSLATFSELVDEERRDDALEFALLNFVRVHPAKIELLRQTPLWTDIAALTPTWTRELVEIDKLGHDLNHYRNITASTHLLAGTAAPSFLYESCHALVEYIPGAEITDLLDRDHFAHVSDPVGFARAVEAAIA